MDRNMNQALTACVRGRHGAAALNNMDGFNAAAPVAVLLKISYADKIKRKHSERK